jgi:phytoene synthase
MHTLNHSFFFEPVEITPEHIRIFSQGSKTYFNSTKFFPEETRAMVTGLYGFVRVADTFVDQVPQDLDGFNRFVDTYRKAIATNTPSCNPIVDEFLKITVQKSFPLDWADAFLYSMELDTKKKLYNSLEETLEYIYGSAEVIGLFMSRLMGLDPTYDHPAKMLGRSMQYINFLRDLAEDISLGRRYIPLINTSLKNLTFEEFKRSPDEFNRFYRQELNRYVEWQQIAEEAFPAIPKQLRIPIKTASDMYLYTGETIYKNPSIVFQTKVKPSKIRILLTGFQNALVTNLSKTR